MLAADQHWHQHYSCIERAARLASWMGWREKGRGREPVWGGQRAHTSPVSGRPLECPDIPPPPPPTPLNSEIERSREALCLHLKVCCSTLLDATVRQKKHFVCFCFLCGGNLLRGAFKELVSIIIQPLSSTQEFQIIFIWSFYLMI